MIPVVAFEKNRKYVSRYLENLKSGLYLQMARSGKVARMQPMVGYIIECLQTQR